MKRVMIVGGPGSGKSTLARLMGARTGLPVYHMDMIHWQPGWVERAPAEKVRMAHEVHALDAWIFEGGFARTYPERMDRADTLIWLDFPLWLRTLRVIRRALSHRGTSRPDMPDNCPERFDRDFLWFLGFIWRTRQSARDDIMAVLKGHRPHLSVHRLTTRAQVQDFVRGLDQPAIGVDSSAAPRTS